MKKFSTIEDFACPATKMNLRVWPQLPKNWVLQTWIWRDRRIDPTEIIIIIIIKTRSTGPCGKNEVVSKLLRQPNKHLRHRKLKKTQLNNKQPTDDCTLERIHHFGVRHRVEKDIPHSNLSRQERPSKLRHSTPWYFKLQWMSCGRSLDVSNSSTLVEADGSSVNRQRLESELTLCNILRHNDKKLNWTKSGHRLHLELKRLKVTFSSWPPYRRIVLKDEENKCKIATK